MRACFLVFTLASPHTHTVHTHIRTHMFLHTHITHTYPHHCVKAAHTQSHELVRAHSRALENDIPVVLHTWLDACKTAQKRLPESDFLLTGVEEQVRGTENNRHSAASCLSGNGRGGDQHPLDEDHEQIDNHGEC